MIGLVDMSALKKITKSKIVCTLGPASESPKMIERLAGIGMDCARINFSHGDDEARVDLFHRIRETDPRLSILCDIQGPKIRIGRVKENGVVLRAGSEIRMTTEDVLGDESRISVMYDRLPDEVEKGDLIYVNDGLVCLVVREVKDREILCSIRTGGHISTRKGVNLPSTDISLKVPTGKDVQDLKRIARLDPEYVAVSFVGDAGDVIKVRSILSDLGNDDIQLISKIERPMAVRNFRSILSVSDGLMVARGDLGVEIPPEEVPNVQKKMIRECNVAGKPVIVATQMLESMVHSPVPTRAEVSDVFNAIEDGADAVMLSAETASGSYPAEAVEFMERIISRSEEEMPYRDPDDYDSSEGKISELMGHLVSSACKQLAGAGHEGGKIICLTHSGYTARMISKYRPRLPILGVTNSRRAAREMRVLWGVEPVWLPEPDDGEARDRMRDAVRACIEHDLVDRGEKVMIAGNVFNVPERTNMISIATAGELVG